MAGIPDDHGEQRAGGLLGGLATGVTATATPAALGLLYVKGVGKGIPTGEGPISKSWAATGGNTPVGIRKVPIERFLRRLNVGLDVKSSIAPEFSGWGGGFGHSKYPGGMVYAPAGRGASRQTAEGVLGHEAGHAVRHGLCRGRGAKRLRAWDAESRFQSRRFTPLLTLLAGAMPVDSPVADAALAGSGLLLNLPQLIEETAASRVGARLLRLKGLAKLRTFKGLPMYALGALAPAIAVGARRGINKLRDNK